MRRSREEAAETRAGAVRAAAALFRERGFDGVGLEDIMAAIGMTHGGFYRHFASKDALAADALEAASVETTARSAEVADSARALIDRYLSREHVAHRERGCPLAALVGDAGRSGPPVRRAFARAVERTLAMVADSLPASPRRRVRAIQILASLVGGVAIARAVGDGALADEVLAAVRKGAAG